MRRVRCLILLLPWLLLVSGSAVAQVDASRYKDGKVNIDFQDADLKDVVKIIAEISKKNFLFDERVRGPVTLISPEPVSVDEAYAVFEAILRQKGFTTVEGPGGITKIIPVREAKESPIPTVTGDRRDPNRDLFITRLLPLRYVKSDLIVNTFRPLISNDANLIAYQPTNTLIITDTAANIRRLLTIISEVDIETYREKIKVIPIEYADAGELTGHLQLIFSEDGSAPARSTRRPTSRSRTQRSSAAAATPTSGTIAGGEPRFIPDERTNSIIVIAPQPTITEVEKLIKILDYKRRGSGRIHVYRLQNADAEEMAQTLASLTQGPATGRGSAAGGAAAAQAAAIAELEGGIKVTADAPTNSLIIQASAEGFAAISDVIEELDRRRPQVMVEALIMEVNVGDGTRFGLRWLFQDSVGPESDHARGAIGFGEVLNPDEGIETGSKGVLVSAILGKTVSVWDAATSSFIEVPVIQAVITASANDDTTNLISAPVLLTADNEEAEIVVGENIPIPTTRLQTASNTTEGFQTSANIERRDVGVTLRVTPQISEGDTVRLQVFQELSEVKEEAAEGGEEFGPTTLNRTVENTVYVKDGEAVMIGGILSETQQETISKVPFLGDIPILGWAFKTTSHSVRKVNLMLILTPHIVRDTDDLQELTVTQRERFRDAAGKSMGFDEDEDEARARAIAAGLELPIDGNPVRRIIESHTERYPTEMLPQLRERREERAEQRKIERTQISEQAGGIYLVQVSLFRDVQDAVKLLRSLLEEGYDGTLLSREEASGTVHFVQLGPYLTDDKAQQVAREVEAETDLNTVVLVQP